MKRKSISSTKGYISSPSRTKCITQRATSLLFSRLQNPVTLSLLFRVKHEFCPGFWQITNNSYEPRIKNPLHSFHVRKKNIFTTFTTKYLNFHEELEPHIPNWSLLLLIHLLLRTYTQLSPLFLYPPRKNIDPPATNILPIEKIPSPHVILDLEEESCTTTLRLLRWWWWLILVVVVVVVTGGGRDDTFFITCSPCLLFYTPHILLSPPTTWPPHNLHLLLVVFMREEIFYINSCTR